MRTPFNNIKLSQLFTLCNIVNTSEIRDIENIRRKYLDYALSFDETLSLLEELKIIKNESGKLSLKLPFSNFLSIEEFKKILISAIFSANEDISDQLRNFLENFTMLEGEIYFKATEIEKIKFSDTRNLLLELDFISASEDNTTYFVNPDYIDLFINHISRGQLSPETLKRKQEENDSIGFGAENAIIEFEIKRLINIPFETNEIEHTSLENVLAGYDIKSFENYFDNNSMRIRRYIEVKAVSLNDFKFYWSKNEMLVAKVYGERYYLYLLPVKSNNVFDFNKLMIVKNPFKNIYLNEFEWKKVEENISISKNI
ncbi:MAG: hypothetical protein A2X61_16555 [Ignavibacteria bacterium GWB2_35_12]|nr:MAG: hypothetical protein A2X63_14080 [Ignavibacteria bacterium GWA2_35_8]OGU37881.1 MAG: hypothetical protein A2X61_16555 [Ignavibacteria bacterium GWB2_35_12]OGU85802.1 MAG: hypothetical protein A2220_02205 [Ignavibacteria bacterium RIFOXYA2_FULL_35_10]OGV19665.1 MAG: hypothetical protein A2475_09965 [Ignavibacteria bacterium RIFOXYC2_FULL_35_21]